MIALSGRLSAIAEFAEGGVNIADIGTDHAYIPIYLAQSGNACRILASDISTGSIKKAKTAARIYGVEDKIEFSISDGLHGINEEFDTVILAGMGGETILNILKDSLWAVECTHLVLQPQSKIYLLINWLCSRGCKIDNAKIVKDCGKIYLVFSTVYIGTPSNISIADSLVPAPLFLLNDPLLYDYLSLLKSRLEKSITGMRAGTDVKRISSAENVLNDVCKMLRKIE